MQDTLPDGQVICRIFRRFQSRAYEETSDEKQDAEKGSTYPHAVGKANATVKQVIQHDGVDDRSERGSSGDETHGKRTTSAKIVRYHCHGRDIHNPLSQSEADPLSKKDLPFQPGGTAHPIHW